jgi:hypothetical protein
MRFLLSLPDQNTKAPQRSLFIQTSDKLQQHDQHNQQNEH